MYDDYLFERSSTMFLQFMHSSVLCITLLLIAILIILAFAHDRISRPRLFNIGAILFVTSIVLPLFCATVFSVAGQIGQGSGRNVVIEILTMLLGIMLLLSPLILAGSVICLVSSMLVPTPSSRLNGGQRPIVPRIDPNAVAETKPAEPHPLD